MSCSLYLPLYLSDGLIAEVQKTSFCSSSQTCLSIVTKNFDLVLIWQKEALAAHRHKTLFYMSDHAFSCCHKILVKTFFFSQAVNMFITLKKWGIKVKKNSSV